MATIPKIPPDFKEFLKLLEEKQAEYLLIGGYAVGYYGYPRATADMDIWVAVNRKNAEKIVQILKCFGMDTPELKPELFLEKDKVIRIGLPPVRLEIQTSVSGLDFEDCFPRRHRVDLGDLTINVIDLDNLKTNKKASGRYKDLDDLEHLG